MPIAEHDVPHAVDQEELGGRDASGTGSVDHDPRLAQRRAPQLERVDEPGQHDDCRTVLVVVKHRHVQAFLERRLDFETPRRRDILQIDAAERRCDRRHDIDDPLGVTLGDADRERFDPTERLEEYRLPFHDRQCRLGPDITEPEHRAPIGHDRDEVPLDRQVVDRFAALPHLLDRCQRRRREIEQVEDVMIAHRQLAADLQDASIAPPQIQRLFGQRTGPPVGRTRWLERPFVDIPPGIFGDLLRVDRPRRFAGFERRLHHRCRDRWRDSEIENLRHDMVRPTLFGRYQARQRFGCVNQRAQTDVPRTGIEKPTEDPRKDERDVHHVRIIGAPGRDHCRTGLPGQERIDLRCRQREGEDDRIRRHPGHHLRRQDVAAGQPDEDIGALEHLGERATPPLRIRLLGQIRLGPVHPVGPPEVNRAGTVTDDEILHPDARQEPRDTDASQACPSDDDPHLIQPLPDHLERVLQRTEHENGRTVVLVGEDGNRCCLLQVILDREAMRCADMVEADGTEGRDQRARDLDDRERIAQIDTDRHGIDPGERLEEHCLRFEQR
ncbi:hypothetical protein HRbin27_00869 [bacterium HR27]|nr:hypothetical protein HRbin27_00869 [bacterium HR27]